MQIFVKEKSFYQTVVKLAVPVVLQSLITIGVNMMDTMMLGSYGEYQLSGSSLANEFIHIFQIMCMGMGYGAAVLTAQYWGSKNKEGLKKTVTIMLRLCFVFSLLFTIISLCIPEQIMRLYTSDEMIVRYGVLYFRISAFTYIPTGLSLTLTAVLRSVREVRMPLLVSAAAFFVNIFFNWVFIFGHLGAPEMQIEGAALGTLIARLFETGVIVGFFFLKDKKIGYRMKNLLMPCRDTFGVYIRYSIPVLISDTLLGLGNSMVSIIIGHMGASFVAANAIVSQVTRMSTVFTQGISSSSSVITGNTLGKGDRDKAYHQGITFLALGIILGIAAAGIIRIVCPFVIAQFEINEETVAIADELMAAVACMVVFQSVQSILTKGVLRGGGDTRFLMRADILFLWLVSVPLGYVTGIVMGLPAFLIYASLKADWIIKSVWCSIRLIQGKWMKQAV